MGRGGLRLMLSIGASAFCVSAAYAQSTVAPTAPATTSQINSMYAPVGRPLPSAGTQQTLTSPGQEAPNQQGAFPPYQGTGYAANNVIWYPSVTGGAFFDDNVFASHNNRQGDWASFVRPELAWRTSN